MRKNVIMGNLAIKSVAFTLLLSSVGLTGCYKDQRLDVNDPNTGTVVVPAAAYSISGTVTDFETGAPVECNVTSTVGTVKNLGNGAYNVTLTKEEVGEGVQVELSFTAENYTGTVRSVYVQKINDGSTIVYPVSVSLKKISTPVEYVDVEYKLNLTFVDDETGEQVDGINYTVEGADELESGNYAAGEYLIKTVKTDEYYGSVTALSLPEAKVKKGEDNVVTRNVVINLKSVTVAPTPDEYVTITGEIRDKEGNLAKAQVVKVNGTNVEPKYNVYYFSFNVKRQEGVSKYEVEAQVLNATGKDKITTSQMVNLSDAEAYNITLTFPCVVKDGQEYVEEDGDATGSVNPEIDEDGVVTETVNNIMSDGTTILLNKGTETNLGEQNLVLVRNTAEEGNNSDERLTIRSYIGLPEGTSFDPALEVKFADIYDGELGNNFELQYLGEDGKTWTTDAEGGSVSFADGVYTMNIAHFSTFRASMKYSTETKTTTLSDTEVVEINRMNNDEYPLNDFKLAYNGKAGSKYSDYAKLVADVNATFSNQNAQELVINTIKGICPEAKEEFGTQEYVGYTNIPGWTMLNNADVTTTTETVTYTVTVNGKSVSFAVETIKSIEISATEKNMTHIGHSHGHGDGDLNNAGGGIVIGE